MKKLFITIISAFMLTGCSLSDVNVEKIDDSKNEIVSKETTTQDSNIVSTYATTQDSVISTESENNSEIQLNTENTQTQEQKDNSENELLKNFGEPFIPEGMVNSGGYLTVDSAEFIDNLYSAGIDEQNILPYTLFDENGQSLELCEGMNNGGFSIAYDNQTNEMCNDWKLLKIHYTFENKSAESLVNNWIPLESEKYDDDIFTVGNLNVCNTADLNPDNKMNYFCFKQVYFSLADSIEYTGKREPTFFRCHNGEKVEFDIVYAVKCDPENLYMSPTTGNKLSKMVNLQLMN